MARRDRCPRAYRRRFRAASGRPRAAPRTARSTRSGNRLPRRWPRTRLSVLAHDLFEKPATSFRDHALGLLKFDQRSEKVLRMQEQYRLAMCADFRLAIAEHASARRLELVARGADVVDFVTDVMDAAVGIALEELRDGRILAERLQQLDFGVR